MDEILIYHRNLHTRAAGGWEIARCKYAKGKSVKEYLHEHRGLSGARNRLQLRVLRTTPIGQSWVKVRTSYIPAQGEHIALTPREW